MSSSTITAAPAPAVTGVLAQSSFETALRRWAPHGFFANLRKAGWDRFNALPMPRRLDEKWRFANTAEITLEGFAAAPEPDSCVQSRILEKSHLVDDASARLVFVDGHLVLNTGISSELTAKGVIFESLADAVKHRPALLEKHLLKSGTNLGGDKFLALHQAYAETGYVLYIPAGVTVEKPFVVYNWTSAPGAAVFPHALVVAEENAKVSIVDFFLSDTETAPALAISASDIHAAHGAGVFRKVVQNWNESVHSHQIDCTHAGREAEVTTVAVNLGAKRARFENAIRINGKAAKVNLYGLTVADNNQEFDQRTFQAHGAPGAYSDLLYKNALLDNARTIFSGMIHVAPDAQQTDAYQTNRNLLLSPDAEANSLPGLEIEANDVKCSHGATTAQIDESELFYFQARGIHRETAKELLVFGFFEEIIGKVDSEELAGVLREFVHSKFRRRASAVKA
jgi:Fe-S cluster assembly protein SufD